VDNSIQIEVLALLDPKSGGVINEGKFAKELTKDLKKLIADTEKTLKQLSVNPTLAVHPKYAGMRDKSKFLAAIKADAGKLQKEAKAVFEKMPIHAKMAVALDIDGATREFSRQLDTLQRSLVAVANSRGGRISKEVSKALNLNPKALVNLGTLTKGQNATVSRRVQQSSTATSKIAEVGNSAALGKQVLKSVSGNIDRVAEKHLAAVNTFLKSEQKKLTKLLATSKTTSDKVISNREARLDAINDSLQQNNKRYSTYVRNLEAAEAHRARIRRTADRINQQGAGSSLRPDNLRLGKDKLDAELIRERAEYRKERQTLSSRERSDRLAYQKSISNASREIQKSLRSAQNHQDLLRKREGINKVIGSTNPIKQLTSYTRGQARTINQMYKLVNDSDVIRKGKVVTVDSSHATRSRKALLTAFNDGQAESLFENRKQTRVFKDLHKAVSRTDNKRGKEKEDAVLRTIADTQKKLDTFLANPNKLDEDGRRALLKDTRDAARAAKRLRQTSSIGSEANASYRRQEQLLDKGVRQLTKSIDNNLSNDVKQRVADRISKGLTGSKGHVTVPDNVTPAQASFIKDLSNSFKDTSLVESVGKKFEDMTRDDFRRLNKWKDDVTKAQRLGLINEATARTAHERLTLAGARPTIGGTGNLAYSRQFQSDYTAGKLSGANTASGLVQSKELLGALNKEINATTKAQREARVIQGQLSDRLRTDNSLDDAQRKQLRDTIGVLDKAYKKHGERLGNLTRHYEKVGGIRGALRDSTDGRRIPTGLGGGGGRGGSGSGSNSSIGLLLRQFARLYLGFAVLGTAVSGVVALVGELATLDTNMKSVQAAALGTTEQMHGIRSAIKAVGITTKFTIGEISDAARVLVQADVPLSEVPATLRATANLAAATDSDVGISADLLTSFSKVYSEYSPDQVASLLTKTFNLSKLNAEDLQTILGISTQTAKTMNLSGEQFLAAVSVLRNQGLKASTAATGLRQGLNEVFTPNTKTTERLGERYAAIGENRSAEEIRRRFADFRDGMSPLVEVISELRRLGFGGSAKKEFSRFINIRGENALNALARGQDDLATKEFQLPFGDSATRASEIQLQGITATIKNLGAAITVLSDSALEPLISLVKDGARYMTTSLTDLDKANTKALAEGRSGIGSTVLTSLIGGAAGNALTRGRSLGTRVGAIAGGAVAGGALGGATLSSDRDVAQVNAGLVALVTAYEAYSLFARRSTAVLSKQSAMTLPALNTASKSVGKIGSGISKLRSVSGALVTGIRSFFGPVAWLVTFALPTILDIFSSTGVEEQAVALDKALLDSQAKIQAAKQAAEQFTDTQGATAASVYEKHATAVTEFNKTMHDAGLKVEDRTTLVEKVGAVIEEGLDANNENYKQLATYLTSNSTLDKDTVGDYIRTFHNLQQASNNSLKAAVTETKNVIAGIEDKVKDGQAVSEVETEMLAAWESMIYSNADVYALFMGDIGNLSADAIQKATGLLKNVQAQFNARIAKAYKGVLTAEQETIDKTSREQSKLFLDRLGKASAKLTNADAYDDPGGSKEDKARSKKEYVSYLTNKGKEIYSVYLKEILNLNTRLKANPTTENIANVQAEKEELYKTVSKLLKRSSDGLRFSGGFIRDAKQTAELRKVYSQTLTNISQLALEDHKSTVGKVAGAEKLAINKAGSLKATLGTLISTFEKERSAEGSKSLQTLEDVMLKLTDSQREMIKTVGSGSAEDFARQYLIAKDGVLTDDASVKHNKAQTEKLFNLLKTYLVSSERYQKEVAKGLGGSDESLKYESDAVALKLKTRKDGATKENKALVDHSISLRRKALESQLAKAKATLRATPKSSDRNNYVYDDLGKAKAAVAKIVAEIGMLGDQRKLLIQGLEKRKPRAKRDTTKKDKAKKQREKDKKKREADRKKEQIQAAIEADQKKRAADALNTLKKRLQGLTFDDTLNSDELKKVMQDRANLMAIINAKELEKANLEAIASEKYLDGKRKAAALERRKNQSTLRLTEAQNQNIEAYETAKAALFSENITEAITKIEREASPKPSFLRPTDQKKDSRDNLLASAVASKKLLALLNTIDPNDGKLKATRENLLAKISQSSQTMANNLQVFVSGSSFGKQLELMDTLIAIQESSPIWDTVARLPDLLSTAIISPFFESKQDSEGNDIDLADRILSALEQGFKAEVQNIATEYFKQGIAGGIGAILEDLLPEDGAIEVQKDLKLANEKNTAALIRLTTLYQKLAEGKDVTKAFEDYKGDGTTPPPEAGDKPPYSMEEVVGGDKPPYSMEEVVGGEDGEDGEDGGVMSGVLEDFKDGFSALFNKDGSLFENIGSFFSEIFGKGSGLDGALSGLLGNIFGNDAGGKGEGDFFSSVVKGIFGAASGGAKFAKGVAGYGKISGAKGRDRIPGLGVSGGVVAPIMVSDGESILTRSASELLGYNHIDDLNAGRFTSAPLSVESAAGSGGTSQAPVNVSVEPGVTQVFVGNDEIERAMNTRAGRQVISRIAKESK